MRNILGIREKVIFFVIKGQKTWLNCILSLWWKTEHTGNKLVYGTEDISKQNFLPQQ